VTGRAHRESRWMVARDADLERPLRRQTTSERRRAVRPRLESAALRRRVKRRVESRSPSAAQGPCAIAGDCHELEHAAVQPRLPLGAPLPLHVAAPSKRSRPVRSRAGSRPGNNVPPVLRQSRSVQEISNSAGRCGRPRPGGMCVALPQSPDRLRHTVTSSRSVLPGPGTAVAQSHPCKIRPRAHVARGGTLQGFSTFFD
jgi:hypothetical protein